MHVELYKAFLLDIMATPFAIRVPQRNLIIYCNCVHLHGRHAICYSNLRRSGENALYRGKTILNTDMHTLDIVQSKS